MATSLQTSLSELNIQQGSDDSPAWSQVLQKAYKANYNRSEDPSKCTNQTLSFFCFFFTLSRKDTETDQKDEILFPVYLHLASKTRLGAVTLLAVQFLDFLPEDGRYVILQMSMTDQNLLSTVQSNQVGQLAW